MKKNATRLMSALIAAPLAVTLLAACGGGDPAAGGDVKLSFANSYSLDHPHNRCGTDVVAEAVKDSGIEIEVFPSSQLGADAARTTSVVNGDIDLDLQGAAGLSSLSAPIGVMDLAYVFDDVNHLFRWFDSDAAAAMKASYEEKTGTKLLDVWYFGNRNFSANKPIRTPEDLKGLRMRFPDNATQLSNAQAMGADAVAVAFEEVYLALQQGTVDGQENPVTTIDQMSFNEVQDYVSLSEHSVGSQLVVMSGDSWDKLSAEQQEALESAVKDARAQDLKCAQEDEEKILAKWETAGKPQVIDDVNREAFIKKAEEHFLKTLDGEKLELFKSIRDASEQ